MAHAPADGQPQLMLARFVGSVGFPPRQQKPLARNLGNSSLGQVGKLTWGVRVGAVPLEVVNEDRSNAPLGT